MTNITTFLLGAAVGAAAMYLADPRSGRGRRTQLEQRAGATSRGLADDARGVAEDLSNRAKGAAAEATRPIRDRAPETDEAVTDRVKSEVLGEPRFSDLTLNVDVVDGEATVRGVVEPEERRSELVSRIRSVPGVDEVIDLTHAAGEPAPNR